MQPGGGSLFVEFTNKHSYTTAKKDPENEIKNSCDNFYCVSLYS